MRTESANKEKRRRAATNRLYDAVASWIKAHGGDALLASGVQIQTWPEAKNGEFVVGVKILGKPPTTNGGDEG